MSTTPTIKSIVGREILNGRAIPAVEAEILLSDGSRHYASAPSGVSVSSHEAIDLRDGGSRIMGKGVRKAVANVTDVLGPALAGMRVTDQADIDARMLELDGTANKSRLGGNAITAVSLAAARAGAASVHLPIYRYVGGPGPLKVPGICPNMLSGSPTAASALDFEDYILFPYGFSTLRETVFASVEIFHALNTALQAQYGLIPQVTALAPPVTTSEEAMGFVVRAIEKAGCTGKVGLGLDVAADQFYNTDTRRYTVSRGDLTREQLIDYYVELVERYPLRYIEDGLEENDYEGFGALTRKVPARCLVIGDDLFATTKARLVEGARHGIKGALFKVNQCGTVTEFVDTAKAAKKLGYTIVASVRSGETEDSIQADLATAIGADHFKVSAPVRGESITKYNRLLRIEEELLQG